MAVFSTLIFNLKSSYLCTFYLVEVVCHMKFHYPKCPAEYFESSIFDFLYWILQFEYDQLVAEKEDKSYCCFLRPIKCWSHRLKSIALHNFEDIDEKENIKRFFMTNGIRLEMIYENSDAFRIVKGKLIRTWIIDECEYFTSVK